jgi:thiamine-phosphate pyrophosphorylase
MKWIKGVYAITPQCGPVWSKQAVLECTQACLEAGVRLVQCRQKDIAFDELVDFADDLGVLCQKYDAALIMNDLHSDLYAQLEVPDVKGLHVGKQDEPVLSVRSALGQGVWVGASCYNQIELARQAVHAGATYVAFGAVYPSHTKPLAVRAELDLFRQASELNVPTVAIGGIDLPHLKEVLSAGANAVAVVSGLYGLEPDAEQVSRVAEQWVDVTEQFGVSK